jgi:phospholipid/cholesterol/gamma-HCH transport system permease protein
MATNTIDRTAKNIVLAVQDYSLFAWRAFINLYTKPRYWPEYLVQSDIVGFGSTPIV